MGYLIDRTNTKHGKARPYLLWLGIPYALTTLAIFTVPDIGTTGKQIYVLTAYMLFILLYTGISISFKSLLGQITQNAQSRSSLGVSFGVGAGIAGIITMTLLEPLASAIGGQKGWVIIIAIFALISIVTIFAGFKTTKERVKNSIDNGKKKTPVLAELKLLFKNKYWLLVSFFGLSLYLLYGLQAAEIYYARYIFGDASYYSFIALVATVTSIVILPIITPFLNRFGKQKTTILGAAFIILSGLIKLIDPHSLTVFLIGEGFLGCGIGIITGTIYAMVNDTVDFGEWKHKVRSLGLANSSVSFGMKVGTGLGGALVGWLLATGGYVGGADQQADSAIQTIIQLNVHFHIILGIIMLAIIFFYKLDKIYPQIIGELKTVKKSKTVEDND
ncbi:MFS transporter [Lysinibacillus endophyticus]|uniref:MFS transporter n=2 Tax=Ureibacillus endophyticus TaxID=1978490 RepID=A0A494YY64_9BACL|nr:MFS transporter [Lysinibacillus endophyticus]